MLTSDFTSLPDPPSSSIDRNQSSIPKSLPPAMVFIFHLESAAYRGTNVPRAPASSLEVPHPAEFECGRREDGARSTASLTLRGTIDAYPQTIAAAVRSARGRAAEQRATEDMPEDAVSIGPGMDPRPVDSALSC